MTDQEPPGPADERIATADGTELVVRDATDRSRFEAWQDGEPAGLIDYVVTAGAIVFVHTETAPRFGGHGVAAALTGWALLRVQRERGPGSLVPRCPFTRRYLAEHPELGDLVAR